MVAMDRRSFLLSVPAALASGCVSVGGIGGPPAPAPTFRVGDRWVYRCSDGYRVPVTWVETQEVIIIDGSGIAVRVTGVGETMNYSHVELLQSPGMLLIGAVYDPAENRRFDSPLTRYRFPLTPGERWTDTIGCFDSLTQRPDVVNRFVQVGGYEAVSVPAGNFNAITMRTLMSVNVDDPFRWPTQCNYLTWWSEAAGAPVRETRYATYLERGDGIDAVQIRAQNTVIELASFSRARG
jgi:hypothetical protein